MKYTESVDGKMRTSIKVTTSLRLTKEQLAEYNEMARALGYRDFKEYAEYKRPIYEMLLMDDFHQNNDK